jgi:hypothetical protein
MMKAILCVAALLMLTGNASAASAGDPTTVSDMKDAIVLGPWAKPKRLWGRPQ